MKNAAAQGGICYRYDVIESVCVTVRFEIDDETSTYGWKYDGGCFEDGQISNWMPAKPGTEYSFDKLDFEIRERNESLATSLGITWMRTFKMLAWISLAVALFALLLYIYQAVR